MFHDGHDLNAHNEAMKLWRYCAAFLVVSLNVILSYVSSSILHSSIILPKFGIMCTSKIFQAFLLGSKDFANMRIYSTRDRSHARNAYLASRARTYLALVAVR